MELKVVRIDTFFMSSLVYALIVIILLFAIYLYNNIISLVGITYSAEKYLIKLSFPYNNYVSISSTRFVYVL